MKKLIFILLLLPLFVQGQIVQWVLTTDGLPTNVDANIFAGNFTAGSGISTITFSSNGASASNWSISGIDLNDYFEISISPNTNYQINLTEINFGERRSLTGIHDFEVRYDKNSDFNTYTSIYTQTVPDVDTERSHQITGLNINVNAGETLYIRFYGYNAEGTTGTWRINDNTLNLVGGVNFINPNDNDSQISAGSSPEPLTISSLETSADGVMVFDFNFEDMASGDGLATIIDQISITQGDANEISDWTNAIAGAKLFGPDVSTGISGTINPTNITFSGSDFISVDDGNNETYQLFVWVKTDLSKISDNDILEFKIDNYNIISDFSGSSLGASSTESGNTNNSISIVATNLTFLYTPTIVALNTPFSVTVSGTDIYGNKDIDATNSVTLSKASGSGNLNASEGLVKSLINGEYTWTTLQYNTLESFSILAEAPGLTPSTSSIIECSEFVYFLNDDFEDGDILGWDESEEGHWGTNSLEPINGIYSLKHIFTTDVTANYTDIITHQIQQVDLSSDKKFWRFSVKYPNDNPYTTNDWTAYLMTSGDQSTIVNNSANGYSLGLNSSDVICLFEVTATTNTEIINTGLTWNGAISDNIVSFEISRDIDATWNIKIDTNGGFDNLTDYGIPSVNSTYTSANYFSIRYRFTKSNAGLISFDDIYFGPEIPDTDAPSIISVTAVSPNNLEILFSEDLDVSSAETLTNYNVDNSIGNPVSAILNTTNNRLVELLFSNTFTPETTYSVTIQNVQDLSFNTIVTVSEDFIYSLLTVDHLNVVSEYQLDVYFTKDVETISAETIANYSVNNSIGNPFSATVDVSNSKLVHLQFPTSFTLETEYVLTVQNIEDAYGNIMTEANSDFIYHIIQKYDVIVNELMIDISPMPVALPAYKYIEIFNNSNYDINLADWTLTIGTNSPKTLPEYNLKSYDYAIICEEASALDFAMYGDTIPVLTSSQLTSTSGKQLLLKDNTGNVIEDITYSPTWYYDDLKDDGGWSIERIDPDNVCNQTDNWKASVNYVGGTPGRLNSVFAENPDLIAPYVIDVEFFSARGVNVYFSEIVDTTSALYFTNYIINDGYSALNGYIDTYDASIVHLEFAENFNSGSNTLAIKNISDYCGNTMNDFTQSFEYELIHPKAIEVKSHNQAIVYFSEGVELSTAQNISNYFVNNSIGNPVIALRDIYDFSKVHLLFENSFTEDLSNLITITNITDVYGNMITNSDLSFTYHIAKQFDIVINELMLDVNPAPVGLPAQQYIELYNTTDYDIWLSDWIFIAESQSDRTFPSIFVPSKGFALICREGYEREFSGFENVIPILGSSDLTQTGKNLKIYDNFNNIIYNIDYSSEWYQDEDKDDGGWSLEKIDPMNFCGEISNWKASTAAAGGTPEAINSIYAANPDNQAPQLINFKIVSSNHVFLQYSENISQANIYDTLNYFVDNNIGYPDEILIDDTSNAVIHLYFENQFTDNTENTLMIENISDNCDNIIENTTQKFTYYLIKPEAIWLQNSKQIQVKFSENVDYLTGTDVLNYNVNNSVGNPEYAVRDAANTSDIILQFSDDFVEGQKNTLSISGVQDVNENTMIDTSFEFTYYLAQPNDIVINEILFNPKPGSFDFVELYNRSDYQIDLINIRIGKRDETTNEIETIYKVYDYNRMFEPHSFLVLTEDTSSIKDFYTTSGTFIQMTSMLSLPDDEGTVVILDTKDSIIDELAYNSSMHFALLSDEEGVSLERIDYERTTEEVSNWHSAAENVGFATPGYENSQYNTGDVVVENEITIEPEVFSPDNDGYEDIMNIHYEYDKSGYLATIKIYDSKGRHIRDLAENELLSVKGIISWDGLDETGNKARIGIYIIFVEVFDIDGNIKQYKKTCVVATKIN